MSTHADTAKAIRVELKKAFPSIKFSVRSSSFAGGDSVSVEWINGPTSDEVNKLVSKYQHGHFDAMYDLYEYSNVANGLPQVKYVQVRREIDESIMQQIFEGLQKTHAYFDKVFSIDETSNELMSHWSFWTARDYIYRKVSDINLTHGYNQQRGVM